MAGDRWPRWSRGCRAETLHTLYASDLQRAWETAQAIATPHALHVHAEPRLREMAFGRWEGLTYDEIQQQDAAAPGRLGA